MAPIETSRNVLRFESRTPDDIPSFLEELIDYAADQTIWLLEGDMGAGKTTFVRMLGEHLGFVEPVQSPTYSIVNEYRDNTGSIYYHFDFYRIKNEREAFEIGCEDYFYSGNICLIEWPSRIETLLPDTYLTITFDVQQQDLRVITVSHQTIQHSK